ncbi:substrate-binding domain-containing protein [Magnetococcus sp. PR-3]|uniref:substrate-binding domain-containing protein n=1 Tax=Magnetococcus sp. PR-3 TaxID=3120355 RepID=UPI002FCE4ED8
MHNNSHNAKANLRMILFLIFALTVMFVSAQAAQAKGKLWRVGFAQDTLSIPWRAAQANTFSKTLMQDKRFQVFITNAQGSTTQQAMDAERLVKQGARVLVSSPRDGAVMTPVISALHQQGTPVVLLTRRTMNERFTTFIAPDDAQIGRHAAQHVAKLLKGKGNVLMIQGLGSASTARQRTQGFVQELANYPNVQITAQPFANYKKEMAILIMESILAQNVPFDAIYAHSDSMALGAILALKRAGKDPKQIPIVSIDYTREGRQAIKQGEINASFTYPTCAKEGAEAVKKILQGQAVPKYQQVPSILVSKENVDNIEPIF